MTVWTRSIGTSATYRLFSASFSVSLVVVPPSRTIEATQTIVSIRPKHSTPAILLGRAVSCCSVAQDRRAKPARGLCRYCQSDRECAAVGVDTLPPHARLPCASDFLMDDELEDTLLLSRLSRLGAYPPPQIGGPRLQLPSPFPAVSPSPFPRDRPPRVQRIGRRDSNTPTNDSDEL